MKWICFDTSTPTMAVSIVEENEVKFSLSLEAGGQHSKRLLPLIDLGLQELAWSKKEIQAVGVGIGPGGFTGLRVGIATAQGLAFALQCPIVALPTLEAVAFNAGTKQPILVCLDARKGEVYAQVFEPTGTKGQVIEQTPPLLLKPDNLISFLAEKHGLEGPYLALGSGVLCYQDVLNNLHPELFSIPEEKFFHKVSPVGLSWLMQKYHTSRCYRSPWEIDPLYLRPSDAELNVGPPEGGSPLKSRLQPDGTITNENE